MFFFFFFTNTSSIIKGSHLFLGKRLIDVRGQRSEWSEPPIAKEK